MLIEAEDRFPHRVIPLARCMGCKRRLTVVLPANTELQDVECKCGERRLVEVPS